MFDEIISKLKTGETSISIDSRTLRPGEVFFAIKGERFDGHAFVPKALEKGALCCVVQQDIFNSVIANYSVNDSKLLEQSSSKVLIVEDTIKALQHLAREYRNTLTIPIIGITGCNGKTTTKNFLAGVLMQHYGNKGVAYTKGNLNNHIGLPLTILSIKPEHSIAVVELGSNHPGEIIGLCDIAKPTYGITTSIGAAHIEFFGTVGAIADEEGAIATILPKTALYVVPKSDQYSEYLLSKTSARKAAVDIKYIECLAPEFLNIESRLREIGIQAPHIIADTLLVIAVVYDLHISLDVILKGLSNSKNDEGRFTIFDIKISNEDSKSQEINTSIVSDKHITIIDDTYNANPDSVIAAIKGMYSLFPNRRKIVALGSLKELGSYVHTGYKRIIDTCNEYDVMKLILVHSGDMFYSSNSGNILYVKDNAECADYIRRYTQSLDVILCKGSHSAKTWEIIDQLKQKNDCTCNGAVVKGCVK